MGINPRMLGLGRTVGTILRGLGLRRPPEAPRTKLIAQVVTDEVTTVAVRDQALEPTAPVESPLGPSESEIRYEAIQAIPLRFHPAKGPLGAIASSMLDARLGQIAWSVSQNKQAPPTAEDRERALLLLLRDSTIDQLAIAEGTSEALDGKFPNEVAERQEIASALLGELSRRLSQYSRQSLLEILPEDFRLLLQPKNEDQAIALAVQSRIEAERLEVASLIAELSRAEQKGFIIDPGERRMVARAKDALEGEPGPLVDPLQRVVDRARSFVEQRDQQRKIMKQVRASSPPAPARAGSITTQKVLGAVGQRIEDMERGLFELSPEEAAQRVEANMSKARLRLDQLKQEVKPKAKPTTRSRFEGAMLGMAVGDCLGSTVEFQPRDQIRLSRGMNTDLIGGGPFHWLPGEPTDDTQMAVAMAKAIVAKGGFDQDAVADRFVQWYDTKPKDIGALTRNTLGYRKYGAPAQISGLVPWAFGGYDNAGNGSVMRAAPVALLTAFASDEELIRVAHESSVITHADPRCTWGMAAMSKGVQLIVAGEKNVTEKVAKWLEDKSPSLAEALHAVPKLEAEDIKTTGYVIDTLQAAFWTLENFDNYVDAIAFIANHGDDTDTAGATGGILLGAKFGAEAIPKTWLDTLRGREELRGFAHAIQDLAKSGQSEA